MQAYLDIGCIFASVFVAVMIVVDLTAKNLDETPTLLQTFLGAAIFCLAWPLIAVWLGWGGVTWVCGGWRHGGGRRGV